MKKNLLLFISLIIGLLSLSTIAVLIVTLPAYIQPFNLTKSETANIGTSLSGITTPFFTAISSILIFYALIKQIEFGKDQRLKSDGDMIFILLNQLDAELESYTYETTTDGNKN